MKALICKVPPVTLKLFSPTSTFFFFLYLNTAASVRTLRASVVRFEIPRLPDRSITCLTKNDENKSSSQILGALSDRSPQAQPKVGSHLGFHCS